MGHGDAPDSEAIPLAFYTKANNPWAHCGVKALNVMWTPPHKKTSDSQTDTASTAEKTPTTSKSGFSVREDGLYTMSSSADKPGVEPEEPRFMPPEIVENVLSAFQDPFQLLKWASTMRHVPSLSNLVWREMAKYNRPIVIREDLYRCDFLTELFPCFANKEIYAPSKPIALVHTSTEHIGLMWHSGPYQMFERANSFSGRDVFPQGAHVRDVEERITYTPVFAEAYYRRILDPWCAVSDGKTGTHTPLISDKGVKVPSGKFACLSYCSQHNCPFLMCEQGKKHLNFIHDPDGPITRTLSYVMKNMAGLKIEVRWTFLDDNYEVTVGDFFLSKPSSEAERAQYEEGIEALRFEHLQKVLSDVALDQLFRVAKNQAAFIKQEKIKASNAAGPDVSIQPATPAAPPKARAQGSDDGE